VSSTSTHALLRHVSTIIYGHPQAVRTTLHSEYTRAMLRVANRTHDETSEQFRGTQCVSSDTVSCSFTLLDPAVHCMHSMLLLCTFVYSACNFIRNASRSPYIKAETCRSRPWIKTCGPRSFIHSVSQSVSDSTELCLFFSREKSSERISYD
jgi:hypothetical protein